MEESNSYFRAVVNDAVNEIKDKGTAYCFSNDQVNEILRLLGKIAKKITIKEEDGIFFLTTIINDK